MMIEPLINILEIILFNRLKYICKILCYYEQMKTVIRFLFTYVLIISAVIAFSYNTISEYKKHLSIAEEQIIGVDYLKDLNVFAVSLAEYTIQMQSGMEIKNGNVIKEKIQTSMNNIYKLQKLNPEFINKAFNLKLEKVKMFRASKEEYYDFFDSINHQNYEIGDHTKLHFMDDRELYFLGSLVTHYMPEYVISLLLSHNIIEDYRYKNSIDEKDKNIFIEQNKLIYLSTSELKGIIKLLNEYEDTKDLNFYILSIENELEKLKPVTESLLEWDNNKKIMMEYIHISHRILDLTYEFNDKTFQTIEKNLEQKKSNLTEKIFRNKIMYGFILSILSILFYFLYRSYSLNLKKDLEIKEISDIVDEYVVFSKTDANGVITYVSKALEELSGYSKEELIGKTHRVIKNDDVDPSVYKEMWDTITDKKVYAGKVLNKRKNGTPYWVEATIIPNLDTSGNITGYSAYRVDITNQKALELEKIKRQEQAIELISVTEALEKLSTLDPLMQIPNRLSLDTNMKVRYDSYQRYKKIFSLIMIDIDYFKSVNDTYGHLVGDDILKSVSKIIQENIRSADVFGRWGGEEFMIICEETDIDGAYALAEKIRVAIEETEFDVVGKKTISLGVAQIEENISINDFIQGADDALFYAKNNGRNRTMKYTVGH